MKPILISFTLMVFMFSALEAQNNIHAGKMTFWNTIDNDSILIKIQAPTRGWLAVGFNDRNEIVGSDLKMFRIVNGQLEAEDQFVRAAQDHPTDQRLGGENNIRLLSGVEDAEGTNVTFKIPMNSNDRFDFLHDIDQNVWLILAYSIEDDFGHHSIMREHFQIKWQSP